MKDASLPERSHEILDAIIHSYVVGGEPVGSRTLEKMSRFGLSAASIRNIMADLEEQGYLAQPHTSAGRIPTDKAYRLFVDELLRERHPRGDSREEGKIEAQLRRRAGEIEELMLATSHLLSQLSHNVGFVLAPDLARAVFRHIEFVPLTATRLLVVIVGEFGLVTNKMIEFEDMPRPAELRESANYLNEEFSGLPLRIVRARILERMCEEKALYDSMLARALSLAQKSFSDDASPGDLYVDGTSSLFDKPEFADAAKMRSVFKAFEQKSRLVKILSECLDGGGLRIVIGTEHALPDLRGCSLVTATYDLGGQIVGTLGVIGPTRMRYGKTIAAVDSMARSLSHVLSEPDDRPNG